MIRFILENANYPSYYIFCTFFVNMWKKQGKKEVFWHIFQGIDLYMDYKC